MGEQKFLRCSHCGNLVGLLNDGKADMTCCGEPMQAVVGITAGVGSEKHLPIVEKEGRLVHVQVGDIMHPTTAEHNIEFIYLLTESGGQRQCIQIGAEPKAMFFCSDGEPIAVYAYCNLHGLWKADIISDSGCNAPHSEHGDNDNLSDTEKCGCGCNKPQSECSNDDITVDDNKLRECDCGCTQGKR